MIAKDTYLYYGGPHFTPTVMANNIVFATYDTPTAMDSQIAAIGTTYGNGRVFLSGIHCEILSDSGISTTDTNRLFCKYHVIWALGNYQTSLPVCIYNEGAEVWATSVSGIESVLTALGISYVERTAAQINASGGLIGTYRAIVMPGGLGVGTSLDANGVSYVLALVNAGGAWIGICSGAYAAASTYIWQGSSGSGAGLFQGTAEGAIPAIAAWPGEAATKISYNPIGESAMSSIHSVFRNSLCKKLKPFNFFKKVVGGVSQFIVNEFYEKAKTESTIDGTTLLNTKKRMTVVSGSGYNVTVDPNTNYILYQDKGAFASAVSINQDPGEITRISISNFINFKLVRVKW